MNEDYTVLMSKRLGRDSLQLLAVRLLPIIFSIVISVKYKVTESTT